MDESRQKRIAPFFLFLSALFWSFNGLSTKSFHLSALCLSNLRGYISFVVMLILLRGHRIKFTKLKWFVAFCYFIQGILIIAANRYTTAANAAVLQNTSPLYIILLNAVIRKRRPNARELVVCALLLVGMGLTCWGSLGGGGTLGNCLALLSALFYACVFFFSKQDGVDSRETLLIGNIFHVLLLPLFLTDSTVQAATLSDWALLIPVCGITGIGAWLCFARGIRHTSALQANFITMAEPVLAPLWTYLFLQERIGGLCAVGCSLVLCTILIYNWLEIRRPSEA